MPESRWRTQRTALYNKPQISTDRVRSSSSSARHPLRKSPVSAEPFKAEQSKEVLLLRNMIIFFQSHSLSVVSNVPFGVLCSVYSARRRG